MNTKTRKAPEPKAPTESVEYRLVKWFLSGDTGVSSEKIASVMTGIKPGERKIFLRDARDSHPSDPSDLGRCLRLLDRVPEWKPVFGKKMAAVSKSWAALIKNWSKLETLYKEEVGSGRAPKCYDLMRAVLAKTLVQSNTLVIMRGDTHKKPARKKAH